MGNFLSRTFRDWSSRHSRRLLILGLDNSGKTTFMEHFIGVKTQEITPTIETNYKTGTYGGGELLITDVGGMPDSRPYWRHHFTGTHGVIFVVDSTAKHRFQEAKKELSILMVDPQLKGVPILVFANKQDMPVALSEEEVLAAVVPTKENVLSLHDGYLSIKCGSALHGKGIGKAFELLDSKMKRI